MNRLRLAPFLLATVVSSSALAQVAVHDPWVRGTVEGQRATGAFMQLVAAADTTLVAATSPIAGTVEVHAMAMEGGMMKMRALDRLPLTAGKPVELKPGGYHVMLVGLRKPVVAGEDVPITLTFEDKAGKRSHVEVKAKVRALGAAHSSGKH